MRGLEPGKSREITAIPMTPNADGRWAGHGMGACGRAGGRRERTARMACSLTRIHAQARGQDGNQGNAAAMAPMFSLIPFDCRSFMQPSPLARLEPMCLHQETYTYGWGKSESEGGGICLESSAGRLPADFAMPHCPCYSIPGRGAPVALKQPRFRDIAGRKGVILQVRETKDKPASPRSTPRPSPRLWWW